MDIHTFIVDIKKTKKETLVLISAKEAAFLVNYFGLKAPIKRGYKFSFMGRNCEVI